MTFLAKLGQFLAKAVAIAAGVGPLVAPYLGAKGQAIEQTAVNDLTSIGQVVVQAEALIQAQGNGATKLAAATPLIQQIVQTSELVSGHKITNETLFTQGCSKITSGVADVLNSLDPGAVKTA
jgi:hypothetical protein